MTKKGVLKSGGAFTAFTGGAFLVAWLAVGPGVAHAYTVSTVITTGCHEQITTDALRAVRLSSQRRRLFRRTETSGR